MRTLLLIILLASQMYGACAASWANGYTKCVEVTLDHTKIPNTDQTNFTNMICFNGATGTNCDAALTTLTLADLKVVASGGSVTDANCFACIWTSDNAGTTLLSWETDTSYTGSSGFAIFYVKKTRSHTVDDKIYLFIGNSGTVTFQGGSVGSAWDSTAALYHFPNGTSLTAVDSSSNARTLTINAATAVAGQIDGATGTDSGKYLHDAAVQPAPLPITTITFSLWVKTTFASNSPYATYGRDTGANQIVLYNLTPKAYVGASGGGITSTTTVNNGNWHFIAAVVDNTNGANNTHLYVDGALEVTGSVTWNISILSATDNLTVGLLGGGSQPFTGSIDEVHIQSTNRSADWIASMYNDQKTPSTFYSAAAAVGQTASVRHRVISQ